MSSRVWGLVAWVAVAALPLHNLLSCLRLPRSCDTTYLWEGYEEVALRQPHPRYKLIKFADRDRELEPAFQRLQQRHVVPVLFVHGHLGTHQQMRSAASETGRELARRLASNASWPLWLQWYGTDFAAEASALDGALLDKQAAFVVQCIEHLHRMHSSPADGQRPFRLMLVAYSMGGLVARAALAGLAASPSGFDLGQVVVLVSLGSPHSFPRYTPPAALRPPANPAPQLAASAAAAAAAVPRVTILAGAGDYSLPITHAATATPPAAGPAAEPTLLMPDMPAVWSTASHKGIVSCNQLVRQLVPLLADAALASLDGEQHGGLQQRQAATRQLLHRRLTTGMARALQWPAGGESDEATAALRPPSQPCALAAAPPPAAKVQLVSEPLMLRSVLPGRLLHLAWDGAAAAAAGAGGLLLLASAAPPCSHLEVRARLADGGDRELAAVAAPLPPLLPSLQQRWVPRHWARVMQGIDWQHNATRLLYLPLSQVADGGGAAAAAAATRITLTVRGSESGGTALVAQLLASHPLEARGGLRLPPLGQATELPAGHPAALLLHLPQRAWPLDDRACRGSIGGRRALASPACWAVLLLGSTPPWALRIQPRQCSASPGQPPLLLPAVVGVQAGEGAGDSVRVVGGGAAGSVALWDGVSPLQRLMLVSDPRCAYSLRLQWDVARWLGLSLRHLLLVLPAAGVALCQARLSPAAGSTQRAALSAALLAAWGSLRPDQAAALSGGQRPAARLSAVEALAALLLADGGARFLGALLQASLAVLRWALPPAASQQPGVWSRAAPVAAAAASAVHPALPAYLGCCCLSVHVAAASTAAGQGGSGATQDRLEAQPWAGAQAAGEGGALAWLTLYSQLALLPSVAVVGWVLGGREYDASWSSGRALTALLAGHACWLGHRSRCSRPCVASGKRSPDERWRLRAAVGAAAIHELGACMAAVACLWGHPYACVYTASCSALVETLLTCWEAG